MDDTGLEYYRYRKLKTDKEDIRLLQIEDSSAGADDTVICQLRHCKVSDLRDVYVNDGAWKKPFDALSYAWGTTSPNGSHLTDMIICDGLPLRVTATLNQGLKRYRESRRHRYSGSRPCEFLWVDAICINQADSQDRSTQVRRMDIIYQSSQSTVIWLGEPQSSEFGSSIRGWLEACQSSDGPTFDDLSGSRQIWGDFLSLPWFNRRWVIQEYTLATNKVFLLGDICIRPSWIIETLEILNIRSDLAVFRHGELAVLEINVRGRDAEKSRDVREALQRSLLARLHQFGSTAYSDPRDSIYALHGISLDRHSFVVDYSRALRQTHLEVAGVYVKDRVTFLPYIISTMRYRRNAHYPSWLVDWSQLLSTSAEQLSRYQTLYEIVSVGRTGTTERYWSKFAPEIGIDGRLSIHAVLLQATDPRVNVIFNRVYSQRLFREETKIGWERLKQSMHLDFAVCLLKHTRVAFLLRKKRAIDDSVYELIEVLATPEASQDWWSDVLEDHIEIKIILA